MTVFSFVDLKNPINVIDLMIYSPISFEDCFGKRTKVYIKGVEIPVASIEDLLVLKRAASRVKDANDILILEKILKERK